MASDALEEGEPLAPDLHGGHGGHGAHRGCEPESTPPPRCHLRAVPLAVALGTALAFSLRAAGLGRLPALDRAGLLRASEEQVHHGGAGGDGGGDGGDDGTVEVNVGGAVQLEAWYVNVKEETHRDRCMRGQLEAAGVRSRRYGADVLPACGNKSFVSCMMRHGFSDCIGGGIDWPAVRTHGKGKRQNVSIAVARNIISNWCSHKRLFSQLADESASDIRSDSPSHNHSYSHSYSSSASASASASSDRGSGRDRPEFILVLEDDAFIDTQRLAAEIPRFVREQPSQDWDLVVIDPFLGQYLPEADHCEGFQVGHVGESPVWGVTQVETKDAVSSGGCRMGQKSKGNLCSVCGAQAWLVRRAGLRRIVKVMESIPTVPLDWLPRQLPHSLAWRPNIANNPLNLSLHWPDYCAHDVGRSSIEHRRQDRSSTKHAGRIF